MTSVATPFHGHYRCMATRIRIWLTLGHVVRVRAGEANGETNAVRIFEEVVFSTRSSGDRLGWDRFSRSPDGADRTAVDHRPRPVDLVARAEPVRQRAMQARQPPFLPVPQTSPAGHPRSAAHLLREVFPQNAGLEDDEDPPERRPVGDARSSTLGAGRRLGDEQFDLPP
jgi:hypothetical protein